MAKKQSLIEDLMDVSARLRWPWGLGLAVATFFFFHYFATLPNPTPAKMGDMGAFAGRQIWIMVAYACQFLFPLAFVAGAGVSAVREWRGGKFHDRVAAEPSRAALEGMSWREFERLVAETFRRKGFEVVRRGGAGPDGGVDIELRLGSDKYLVQCKQWKSSQVGVAVVRELFGVMAAEHAVGGFVVASGHFTDDARRFAEGRAIELVDTHELLQMVEATRGNGATAPTPISSSRDQSVPSCPLCGASMTLRRAKRGANAGKEFWGCMAYPVCRGTRSA